MYTRIIQPVMEWDALQHSLPVVSQYPATDSQFEPLTSIKVETDLCCNVSFTTLNCCSRNEEEML